MKRMLVMVVVMGIGGLSGCAGQTGGIARDGGNGSAVQAGVVDVGNTKCVVSPEDDVVPGLTSIYQGKLYHFCCKGCKGEFDNHPEKYVAALEADPGKYGVGKGN